MDNFNLRHDTLYLINVMHANGLWSMWSKITYLCVVSSCVHNRWLLIEVTVQYLNLREFAKKIFLSSYGKDFL